MEYGKRKYIGQDEDEKNKLKSRAIWVFIILAVLYFIIGVAISFSKHYSLSIL